MYPLIILEVYVDQVEFVESVIADFNLEVLADCLTALGVTVLQLPANGHSKSLFVGDTSIAIDNRVLLSNPSSAARRAEIKAVEALLKRSSMGISDMSLSTPSTHILGNDVLFTGILSTYCTYLCGDGKRTTDRALQVGKYLWV
jgi:N-dimethylarginine dimethylaminohydrolase